MKTILVTGGCGFILSNFIEKNIDDYKIVNFDNLTYAGSISNIQSFKDHPNFTQVTGDINNLTLTDLTKHKIDFIVHGSAESHVDNSINNSDPFVKTNVNGTVNLLNVIKEVKQNYNKNIRFVHVSTDEVFGELVKIYKSV